MNYVILNSDGSLLTSNLEYYIQQGNSGDEIFIGMDGALSTDSAVAVCVLPNQTTNTLAGVFGSNDIEIDGETVTYSGWTFTLTTDQTTYAGLLNMAVQVVRSSQVIVSYPVALVINETGVMPDTDTGITIEEINSYLLQLQSLTKKDVKYYFASNYTSWEELYAAVGGDDIVFICNIGSYLAICDFASSTSLYYEDITGSYILTISDTTDSVGSGTTSAVTENVDLSSAQTMTGVKTFSATPIFASGEISDGTYTFTLPSESGTLALTSDLTTALASYYTSSQVDTIVTTLKANQFIVADYETYTTLDEFLATEGEEGYIYLYPIDTSDLTSGYYQYIWENDTWLSIGTTVIDLSNYYTKTEIDAWFTDVSIDEN